MTQNPLLGLWRLRSWTLTTNSGEIINPFGEHPLGYLCYTSSGFMSVHLMKAERIPFDTDNVLERTPEEALQMTNEYSSYCGQYKIEGDTVKHCIELVSTPNWINTIKERHYQIDGDNLILSTLPLSSNTVDSKLVWEKAALWE